jgi:hypothetical protein
MCQTMALCAKVVALNMQYNFSRDAGETEQHLLRHLLYAGIILHCANGTPHFRNVNNCLNTNIYSYLETTGGQSSILYLNVVHFFNTSVN